LKYVFGDCELDLDGVVLTRAGVVQRVEPQVFEVLALLIRERGRMVPKEELLDSVWGSRFVGESALTSRIKSARQAIGDTDRERRLIRTVHGRGYQFTGQVVELDGDAGTPESPPLPWTAIAGDGTGELLEREPELAVLRSLWAQARAGRGSIVLVSGESGAGKTALARAAASAAAADSARVLWGMCTPLATPAPLEPLREAAAQLGGPLAMQVEQDQPVPRILPPLLVELTRAGSVLVLDDLQWADQATIDLLRLLTRRVHRTRTLVIGTHRDEEIGIDHPLRGLIGDVARSTAAQRLSVGPLSRDAVAAIVATSGRDPDDVFRLTAGNAFFVQEVATTAGDGLPSSVRDAVLARTADLPPAAQDVLALLACAPEAVPDVALPALNVDLPTLRALDQTGLVERGTRGLRFRHELCRLALAELIPPGGEVALHARVLQVLERKRTDPAVLTHHARGAKDPERVTRYASAAGWRATATGAHVQAVEFFQLALAQQVELAEEEHAKLLEAMARELYLLDRLTEAVAASARARAIRVARGDSTGVGSVCHTLSLYEYYNADREHADRHAAEAIRLLEPSDDLVELGHAYATEAYLAIQRNDLRRADEILEHLTGVNEATGDFGLRLRADMLHSIRDVVAGHQHARKRALEVATVGLQAGEYYPASTTYSLLVYCDVEQRRFAEARELLRTSLPLATEHDIRICAVWQLGAQARLNLLTGDWDQAVRDAGVMLGPETVPLGRPWADLVCGLINLRRGDEDGDMHLDAAWELATRLDEPLRILPAATALVERAWLTGERDDRIADVTDLLRRFAGEPGLEWSLGDLAVWILRWGGQVPDEFTVAEPHRLALAGDDAGAAQTWGRIGEPYSQALTLLDSGRDPAAFRALELLDTLGAAAVAAKVRQQLRDRGVSSVPAGPRATTRANPAGLTERQVEVLAMLAEGLSNAQLASRLFISSKTVDHHVSAILSKLHASSRTEAVHIARERGIIG
jgi:DNA-binding winged helix-turn-helix (wHTH) protein/DNA-binding CsgD family transcriptional regulator/tetratricopeptide (TPR) repeat protein